MKRVIILTALFLMLFGINALAEECVGEGNFNEIPQSIKDDDSMELFALDDNELRAKAEIERAMSLGKTTVYLKAYNLSLERARFVILAAYYDNPEFIHVDTYYHYTYNSSTNKFSNLMLTYPYSDVQVEEMRNDIECEKKKVVEMVDPAMTDLEKVMFVHNYILLNHTYDYNYEIYDIHGFFTKRTGVCSSYAKAMLYFLRALDVECTYVTSDEMNHVWNMVKIDGMWYHIDATWNDTISSGPEDNISACYYTYFLKSDNAFEKLGHYAWDTQYEATSAWYDDYYWKGYCEAFMYDNGEWYVGDEGTLYKVEHLKYGGIKAVFTPEAGYISGWHPAYGLHFGLYAGSVIYNLGDGIYVVNLNDYAKPRKIISYDEENCEIYYMNVIENVVTYLVGANSVDCTEKYSVVLDSLVSLSHFEIKSAIVENKILHLGYTYDNMYDSNWNICIAAYDEENTMIFVKFIEPKTYSVSVPEADSYKVFIIEGCMPLCDSKTIRTENSVLLILKQ